ncbi:MAG: hypothetical protein R3C24_20010 [Cyanobacteriota/Melainabacteria group bacterium]
MHSTLMVMGKHPYILRFWLGVQRLRLAWLMKDGRGQGLLSVLILVWQHIITQSIRHGTNPLCFRFLNGDPVSRQRTIIAHGSITTLSLLFHHFVDDRISPEEKN